MKIISLTEKRKNLTAICLEDGSEYLVDSDLVMSENLTLQSEIEDIDQLLFKSDFKRAKSRSLWYLSRSDHSKKALADKLLKGGFSEESVDLAVTRMEELGLINDETLAVRLFEYFSSQKMSKNEIYHKLILKGIERGLAKDTVFCNDESESEKIKELLKTKYASKLDSEENIKKVYASLVRKGFTFSDIKEALKIYSEELENSEDSYGV